MIIDSSFDIILSDIISRDVWEVGRLNHGPIIVYIILEVPILHIHPGPVSCSGSELVTTLVNKKRGVRGGGGGV